MPGGLRGLGATRAGGARAAEATRCGLLTRARQVAMVQGTLEATALVRVATEEMVMGAMELTAATRRPRLTTAVAMATLAKVTVPPAVAVLGAVLARMATQASGALEGPGPVVMGLAREARELAGQAAQTVQTAAGQTGQTGQQALARMVPEGTVPVIRALGMVMVTAAALVAPVLAALAPAALVPAALVQAVLMRQVPVRAELGGLEMRMAMREALVAPTLQMLVVRIPRRRGQRGRPPSALPLKRPVRHRLPARLATRWAR